MFEGTVVPSDQDRVSSGAKAFFMEKSAHVLPVKHSSTTHGTSTPFLKRSTQPIMSSTTMVGS